MNYLNKGLSKEIREKLFLLERVCGDESAKCKRSLIFKKMQEGALLTDSLVNSYRIEYNPKNSSPRSSRHNEKRLSKKGLTNLREAFKWGKKNLEVTRLNKEFIENLNLRIAPELYPKGFKYPTTRAYISGASVNPPYPEKIQIKELPNFFSSLNQQLSSEDPIERLNSGIFAHFQIARIHPFMDGNGRTARMLQDLIFEKFEIPIPAIKSGERGTYFTFLYMASRDWKEQNNWESSAKITEGERNLYTFIAEKVNISLDYVLDKMKI